MSEQYRSNYDAIDWGTPAPPKEASCSCVGYLCAANGRVKAKYEFAGVDPYSTEGHLRDRLYAMLHGQGAESVEDAVKRQMTALGNAAAMLREKDLEVAHVNEKLKFIQRFMKVTALLLEDLIPDSNTQLHRKAALQAMLVKWNNSYK